MVALKYAGLPSGLSCCNGTDSCVCHRLGGDNNMRRVWATGVICLRTDSSLPLTHIAGECFVVMTALVFRIRHCISQPPYRPQLHAVLITREAVVSAPSCLEWREP